MKTSFLLFAILAIFASLASIDAQEGLTRGTLRRTVANPDVLRRLDESSSSSSKGSKKSKTKGSKSKKSSKTKGSKSKKSSKTKGSKSKKSSKTKGSKSKKSSKTKGSKSKKSSKTKGSKSSKKDKTKGSKSSSDSGDGRVWQPKTRTQSDVRAWIPAEDRGAVP